MFSSRAAAIKPSSTVWFADVATALQERGEPVIDMSAGRAAEATDAEICAAAKQAMDEGDTHQTPARGTSAYLAAVSEKLSRENGLDYAAESGVMATLGCKNGLTLALMSLLDPGDEVIVEDPCFVSYAPTIMLCGGFAVTAPLRPGHGYRWRRECLEAALTPRTKAIIVCSPHNPLGVVHTPEDIEVIRDFACEHDLAVIADEIYEAVVWGGRKHSPIAAAEGMRERTIGLMGMTKSYSMGGWRVGYAYGPDRLIEQMSRTQAHLMTCVSALGQRAGAVALSAPVTGRMRATVWREWEKRCAFVAERFDAAAHLSCKAPEGGFYAWLDISACGVDSTTFAKRLLKEMKVSTVPGASFGPSAEGFLRVTCVKSEEDVTEGVSRIIEFSSKL